MLRTTLWIIVAYVLGCCFSEVACSEVARAQLSAEQVQRAVKRLDVLTQQTLEKTGVPGIAVAVIHEDKVVIAKGYGVCEAGKRQPINADTVFQIASVSKPLSSTVMAALVGEGHISWDDRVIDHDSGFRMYHPFVTRELRLRDLLCHRSGLPDHAGDLLEDMGYDYHEILKRLRYQPPASSLRTEFAYTNFGYSEACYAAALAQGRSWADLAEEKVFKPLGMASTSYRFADYAKAENRALLHVPVEGKWIAQHTRQPDAQAPAGGASSTLNDLVKWIRLQLNDGEWGDKQLVAEVALAETHTPQILLNFTPEQGRLVSYGLGWNVSVERGGRVFCKHSGAFSLGARTEVAMLPGEKLGIIVLSNAAPTGIPEGLTESFFDLVLDGKLERDWIEFANRMFDEEVKRELGRQHDYSHPPAKPFPSLSPTAYTGKYANDFFGIIEIVEEPKGKLVLRLGPKLEAHPLTHWDRDLYIFQPRGEMAGGPAGVRFSIDADLKADRVLIENLNVHGLGTFSRAE